MRHRLESTVIRCLSLGWYVEEICKECHMEPLTVRLIARRNGLKAYAAPLRPNFMRLKKIHETSERCGKSWAANLFRCQEKSVLYASWMYRKLDKARPVQEVR